MNAQLEIFHNTTSLDGGDLSDHRFRAGRQNKRVLDFFKSHSYENYIPFEVWKCLGVNNAPITSIRRSISDLTDLEYLIKLDGKDGRPLVQRKGEYNEKCYCWQIK